jgi:hypothetical protein
MSTTPPQKLDRVTAGDEYECVAADQRRKSFACLILGQTEPDLLLLFNADTRSVGFFIPPLLAGKIWRLAVDASRTAPDDLFDSGKEFSMQGQVSFRLEPRSSAILGLSLLAGLKFGSFHSVARSPILAMNLNSRKQPHAQ